MQKRIVIVDDKKDQTEILTEYLDILGYNSIEFHDPEDAIDFIYKDDISLVLMDQKLSKEIDGWDAIKLIRDKKPEQRVIMMSGYDPLDLKNHPNAIEIDGFIRKPFLLNELKTALEKILFSK